MTYRINTTKTWFQTEHDIEREFRLWKVAEHFVGRLPNNTGAEVKWLHPKGGQTVKLQSTDQDTPARDLRKLFLIIEALRQNEVRGFVQQAASFYAQTTEVAVVETGVDRLGAAYIVLGLRPDAEWESVVGAHRALSQRWHPDAAAAKADPELANRKIREINGAFDLIKTERGK